MTNVKTAGDELFERYLGKFGGYEFSFEPDYAAELDIDPIPTRPDYLVTRSGERVVCEVNHFEERHDFADETILAPSTSRSDALPGGPPLRRLDWSL